MAKKTNFGDRLKSLRETKGWNQAELAGRAGLPSVAISHFETGVRPSASAATLVKLANALEVSVDYLLSRTDDPQAVSGRMAALLRTLGGSASAGTVEAVLAVAQQLAQQDRARANADREPATEKRDDRSGEPDSSD